MKALWKRLLGSALPIALAATVAGVAPASAQVSSCISRRSTKG
jgi:hypothetical protein